jgi:hypothetical protein
LGWGKFTPERHVSKHANALLQFSATLGTLDRVIALAQQLELAAEADSKFNVGQYEFAIMIGSPQT